MKYVDLRLRLPDRLLHPMQAFIRHENAVRYEELIAWNVHADAGLEYELFYVEGDRDPYRRALDDVESVDGYSIAPIDDRSFNVYARQRTRPETTSWRDAFLDRELIVVPPIRFDDDAVMGITLVGDAADVQRLIDDIPATVDVTIAEIGTYDRPAGPLAGELTRRQLEAVRTALELGYYDVPREAPLESVAEDLGIAESSASVLLRRAERAALSGALDRYGAASRGTGDGG